MVGVARMYQDQGDARPNDVVREVTGRERKDLETYAAGAAAAGAWRS